MDCKDISRALAAGAGLPPGAEAHLRGCESCRRLASLSGQAGPEAALSPEAEARWVALVTADLRPVSALGPLWRYTALVLAVTASVAIAGITFLGTTGWVTSSVPQRWYFAAVLAAGIVASATLLPRLMIPGTLQRFPPALLAAVVVIPLFVGAFLYPTAEYEHFARAVAACFAIGTVHASVVGALCAVVLRKGFVVSKVAAALVSGLAGGLTGCVVLFVFCPHHDSGHYLLAHVSAVIFATAAGPAVAYLWDLRRRA